MNDDGDIRPGELRVDVPPAADASLRFIGRIRTPFASRADCPKGGDAENGPICRIEVFEPWVEALDGVAGQEHLLVLYWMDQARRDLVRQSPRGHGAATGTFALRSPVRPNPIAASVVRLLAVEGATLSVRGLDCIDGTPLLDLKPERRPA